MKHRESNGFWEGGYDAWWDGLRAALHSAADRLKAAEDDDDRDAAQAELDRLKEQRADANQNSDRWLF